METLLLKPAKGSEEERRKWVEEELMINEHRVRQVNEYFKKAQS